MRDSSGVSKGSGFVSFSKPEEALRAMEEINAETNIRNQVFALALANATLEQQRTIPNENLYALVEKLEPESAAKITGVILEMDHTQVLHLLESKVTEAKEVLRSVSQQQQQSIDVSESPMKHSISDHKATKSANSKPMF